MTGSPYGLYGSGQSVLSVVLIFSTLFGLLALVHPRWFTRLATRGSQWIDSGPMLECFNRRFDIDRYVLPYARLFGVLVIASVGIFAYRWLGH